MGCDLITFKSILHDWPDADAKRLLARASNALAPGGTLLIFERAPLEDNEDMLHFHMLPMLLFFRSFRPRTLYLEQLAILGLNDIQTKMIQLEVPFFLITGSL